MYEETLKFRGLGVPKMSRAASLGSLIAPIVDRRKQILASVSVLKNVISHDFNYSKIRQVLTSSFKKKHN